MTVCLIPGQAVFFMEVIMTELIKVKEVVEKIGLKAEEVTDEIIEKVSAYKAEMDTQTRRQMRVFWGSVSALCLVAGYFLGRWI